MNLSQRAQAFEVMQARGIIIAAPSTGAGKTTITLGLLRALKRRGLDVVPAKIGPDYIDPQYHQAASGRASISLDAWAMRQSTFNALADGVQAKGDVVIAEGVMGLFDGAERPGGQSDGSTAEVARRTGWPVVLVINCSGLAQSVAPIALGFKEFDENVRIAGVILNKVAGERHRRMLLNALGRFDLAIFGSVMRRPHIELPSRHLGLVQAEELTRLETLLDQAGDAVEEDCELDALLAAATSRTQRCETLGSALPVAPLGQRIAVANDVAFRFAYPHVLCGWREAGAELMEFSPLADEPPSPSADAIYLPGGYPELHGAKLAASQAFMSALRAAAESSTSIFGECGGYMVLGEGIIDADGHNHEMAGLLGVQTSFSDRRLHLGYRFVEVITQGSFAPLGQRYRGHEFHYAGIIKEDGKALFRDLETGDKYGLTRQNVSGSFMHLIDRAENQ